MSTLRGRDTDLPFRGDSLFLRQQSFSLERDIVRIAFRLFDAEKRFKDRGTMGRIIIPISEDTLERIDAKALKAILRDLLLLILLEKPAIEIKRIDDRCDTPKREFRFPKKDAIVLFSAGVDSYCGIRMAERRYKRLLGLFVAHNDQKRIIHIANQMKRGIKTPIHTMHAPGMGSTGYSQLRGFLYVLCAGVYASVCRAREILVTECGPTMYQPMFSTYDSITYTTHPYVMKAAQDVLNLLLPTKVSIVIPFEDLTKAEVISSSGIKDFSMTHSCISQMFGNHEGSCFGCVVRRLACLVSGVRDADYVRDVLNPHANQDNLLNLLVFSTDLMHDPDAMPALQTEKIREFGKEDLFHRYALDNLAGLMLGVSKKHPLRRRFVSGEAVLRERIRNVREKVKRPDFTKGVE
jgi:7-cyano-7-deazaguanine synthase in queuosine biosynthesis